MATTGRAWLTNGWMIRPTRLLRTTSCPLPLMGGSGANPVQRRYISVGDRIPSVGLKEDSPGIDINVADELAGKGVAVLVGVPGAFSPGCSANHVPGYLEKLKTLKNPPKDVYIISVNDPFTTKAWKDTFSKENTVGVRFLADPSGEFAKAMQMTFDKSVGIFGNLRNKRYAVVVKNGRVSEVFEESDNTSINISAADKVLEGLSEDLNSLEPTVPKI